MAHIGKVAGSYAKGVFDFLGSPDKVGAVAQELTTIAEVIDSHDELGRVLSTSVFAASERAGVVEDLVKKLKLSDATRRIAMVLAEANRVGYLKPIVERLHRLVQEAAQVVPLEVTSAVALESAEKKKVEQKFKTLLGMSVEASYAVDPDLIGGLRVTAQGRTYDGSLLGQLRSMEEKLTQEA